MLKEGDKVKVVRCKTMPFVIGLVGTVIRSDNPTKIKVSFNQSWHGYYTPTQLDYADERKSK